MVFCDKIRIISTLGVFIFERQVVIMIDIKASEEIIDYCMSKGINYYDTAWGYHSGNSELVVGDLLQKYDRDSFFLASKFPGYSLENMPKVKEIFEEQLRKCKMLR